MGRRITTAIDARAGYEAYYAEYVQELSGLSEHVFRALHSCSCAVAVLHDRGRVQDNDGPAVVRSSVWINQEVAILAYRQFSEARQIPILAFKEPAVSLEGAMSAFILNPRPICDADSVLREVEDWLEGPALRGPTCDVERFEAKWSALTRDERVMLAGLVAEGGIRVKETTIQRFLGDHSGVDARSVPLAFLVARSGLLTQGLVEFRPDIYSGNEMSLHPTWEWHVRQAVAEHREEDLPPSP